MGSHLSAHRCTPTPFCEARPDPLYTASDALTRKESLRVGRATNVPQRAGSSGESRTIAGRSDARSPYIRAGTRLRLIFQAGGASSILVTRSTYVTPGHTRTPGDLEPKPVVRCAHVVPNRPSEPESASSSPSRRVGPTNTRPISPASANSHRGAGPGVARISRRSVPSGSRCAHPGAGRLGSR